ncbi:hypothetical protein BH23GEM2_BH23GEM2_23180 [soil metagenome]
MRLMATAIGGLLVAASACGERNDAGDTPLSRLAAEWSGNEAAARCQDLGPRGEYLGARMRYCEWQSPEADGAGSRVGAHVDEAGRPTRPA